ncbi:N-acetyltransferase [Carnobacterium divergens]|uniref:GNAT family N-acetyltransferase n=1 Tax=Carnobacterium divergens TaxID=2748 RepID=UPI000E721D8E|nr:GNAT family N-acetyltransferase [Carnobacterium divergens]AOA00021.1 RibT protein [Carnobacterium divergens]MDT1996362.1 GNAT family N-acetyltransferase [Carnobacterium divergens]MDT2010916.1 GNAT family N-acetyltransferase [Carnobacterium divergens]TFI62713.1 N-acetyltransferase [Carnobacterium divergens]TFI63063.1 N-acetyltransferase [Carnobacterium divergens]
MLINYKNDYEKIMMGLLSFIPDLKDVSRLKSEIEWYEADGNRQLYLWRSEESTDIIAVVGVEISEEMVLLRHISINPSYRKEGISYQIINELEKKAPDKKIIGTLETAPIVAKWEQQRSE